MIVCGFWALAGFVGRKVPIIKPSTDRQPHGRCPYARASQWGKATWGSQTVDGRPEHRANSCAPPINAVYGRDRFRNTIEGKASKDGRYGTYTKHEKSAGNEAMTRVDKRWLATYSDVAKYARKSTRTAAELLHPHGTGGSLQRGRHHAVDWNTPVYKHQKADCLKCGARGFQ